MIACSSVDELAHHLRSASSRLRVRGAGSKPALCGATQLTLTPLSGLLQYDPSEYTFTALAGTSLREIEAALDEHGQFLPFDPVLVEAGATLGGSVASGLAGPGRLRFGGIRDFVLGVRFLDGEGEDRFGGGKVVKNAAGFDVPKLMVGALGELGVMVELTFKVFPRPKFYRTLELRVAEATDARPLANAVAVLRRLANSPLECSALELQPPDRLWVRFGGFEEAIEARVARLEQLVADAAPRLLPPEEDAACWNDAREFRWVAAEHWLVKLPLTSGLIEPLEARLAELNPKPQRRYGVAGNVAWLGWPAALGREPLEVLCRDLGCSGLIVRGGSGDPRLNHNVNRFYERLQSVFDPQRRFVLGN